MSYWRAFAIFLALPLLAACGSMGDWGAQPDQPAASAAAPAVAAPDTVTLRLAEAAEKAATALNTISGVEQMRSPAPDVDDYSAAPPELMEPVTITWVGPAEQFLQMMAARAGYQFRVLGARPTASVTITVDEYQQPLIKLVKSAALQMTGRADIVLDASHRALEMRYAASEE
ncbi:MAG: DotD/TraH family lipoprotein [Bdellovibrionales bacterium]